MLHREEKFEICPYTAKLLNKIHYFNQLIDVTILPIPKVNIDIVQKSIWYAKYYHGLQLRQTGEPYYTHPIEVAYMVLDFSFNLDTIVTAILHDTIEDTDLTFETIRLEFNEVVAHQVKALTKLNDNGDKIALKDTIKLLYANPNFSQEMIKDTITVKSIDRLHNSQTLHVKSPSKQEKIINETVKDFLIHAEIQGLHSISDKLYRMCYEAKVDLCSISESNKKVKNNLFGSSLRTCDVETLKI